MLNPMIDIHLVDLIARGGGGGSGGGSGGGGSVIILIGYVPMHFIGAKLKKYMPAIPASIIGWLIAVIYSITLMAIFKGWGFFMGIGAIMGTGAGLYGWFDKIAKLGKKAKKDLAIAAAKDHTWDEATLLARAEKVFYSYQRDWNNNNIEPAKAYMTSSYYRHAELMILALKQTGRQDFVVNPKVAAIVLTQVQDAAQNTNDAFVVAITAQADDQLFDMTTKTQLFRDTNPFTEFWRFDREGNTWLLADIRQATENVYMRNVALEQFASKYNMFYSPDWGWLLLPIRGQLFGKANFGKSDINNHVIGVYNNILIQLYNYIPIKTGKEAINNYLIAQVALPKSYGNIVVRRRRKIGLFSKPKGLTQVSLEWKDFNNRYEVWASDMERVTSFELLHPAFMVKLQELPFEVNIEVVDSVVYLYSAKVKPTPENYQTMLAILQEAFKQMRM